MRKWGIVETVVRWRLSGRGQRLSAKLRLEIVGDECSGQIEQDREPVQLSSFGRSRSALAGPSSRYCADSSAGQ